MDRHNIGAGGWQPGLLPELASLNHWHPRTDVGIEEMQGNGWRLGAGGKAFGRQTRRRGREMVAGEPQGRRSTTPGRQASSTKGCDRRMAEPAAVLKKPFGYGFSIKKKKKKRFKKGGFATSPALKATQASSTSLLVSIALLRSRSMMQWGQVPAIAREYGGFFPLQFYKLWLKSLGLCAGN